MSLHPTTFDYLSPSDEQKSQMVTARSAAKNYASIIDSMLPDCADKTYALRKLREVAMWVNVVITRQADGEPRT